jgi:adenylate cyclase
LDPNYYKAHQLIGYIFWARKEHGKAIDQLKRSIIINPNNDGAYVNLGMAYYSSNRPLEGIEYINKALKLDPLPPSDSLVQLGIAYAVAEEYEKAIEAFRKSVEIDSGNFFSHIGLAGTYAALDREEEARAEAKKVISINPNFSLDKFLKVLPFENPVFLKRFGDFLRKAGLK